MHLREARGKNKVGEFMAEKAKTHPKASHHHFHATLKSMLGAKPDTPKPAKRTSKRGARGG